MDVKKYPKLAGAKLILSLQEYKKDWEEIWTEEFGSEQGRDQFAQVTDQEWRELFAEYLREEIEVTEDDINYYRKHDPRILPHLPKIENLKSKLNEIEDSIKGE